VISVLVADDHEVVRQGVRRLLEQEPAMEICGEATTGREAVNMAMNLKPHVVVMDMTMPELNGLDATRQIRQVLPETEVLIFTMHQSEQLVREAVRAGARGYVLKSDPASNLVTAVEILSNHRSFLSAEPAEAVLHGFLWTGSEGGGEEDTSEILTTRERQVLQMLAEGKTNRDVADVLGISVKTVETHRATIMRKLGMTSVVELVHYAIRNHLIEP
jgi:DNA-binding NarL/FixJ family response regulator